ncbi:MAG: 50S ribosomal protein L19 [Parcubacteria group bacterium GW2011_GWA2_47_7]|nr:MAG: 50S ribosomal protein L19 [Parcubacteria group bacterium GW2011_GWA2_47_7]
MNSTLHTKFTLSPVDMESRRKLDFRTGDTVRVFVKVLEDAEKKKYRLQAFEGMVLARKHGKETGATFTIRKVASNVGVERIFPLYSPMIDRIELVKQSTVRRSKLYYVREKAVRDVRRKLKQTRMGGGSTKDFEATHVSVEAEPEVVVAE